MAVDHTIGKDCVLHYNSGTYSTPTWVAIPRVGDVTDAGGKNTSSLATRETGYDVQGAGLKTKTLSFTYLHKPGGSDTVHDALRSSYDDDTQTEFYAADGAAATTGTTGYRWYGIVTKFDFVQELEGGSMWDVEIVPAREDDSGTLRLPVWYEVA